MYLAARQSYCSALSLVNLPETTLYCSSSQDFGDTIPGHGGIMDRFDCQYLMATFVNVYIASFIRYVVPYLNAIAIYAVWL